MDDKEILNPFTSEMMEKIERNIRGAIAKAKADTHDGLWNKVNRTYEIGSDYIKPKLGDVFAGIKDGKVCSISIVEENTNLLFLEKKIELPTFNISTGMASTLEVTAYPGVFISSDLSLFGEESIYVRIDPRHWAKAMKCRDMYVASLNALFSSITPAEPFIEQPTNEQVPQS